jgi:hypothetical protein
MQPLGTAILGNARDGRTGRGGEDRESGDETCWASGRKQLTHGAVAGLQTEPHLFPAARLAAN